VSAFVVGTGISLPERVVTNQELARPLGLDADWIHKASGIRCRRWAPAGTTTSSLASKALEQALMDSSLTADSIDYLLFGTMTPDRYIPGCASAVQTKLGLNEIPCLDIRATCCNLLYGVQVAKALIDSGTAQNVAVCLAEIQSSWLQLTPDAGKTSMLFGDGASALIVSSKKRLNSFEIVDVLLKSNGSFIDDLGIRSPGTEFGNASSPVGGEENDNYAPRMVGQSVILQAVRRITAVCQQLMERNNITIEDVRWMVPHQANANLLDQVARALKFPAAARMISVLEELGNTSSAAMGIALDMLRHPNIVAPGDFVLLPAFGAGFTWGCGLCRVTA